MSTAMQTTNALAPRAAAPLAPANPGRQGKPALARRLGAWLSDDCLPRVGWTISRTGRTGVVGIALLFTAALFLVSTHLKVAADVEALRSDLQAARGQRRTPAGDKHADPAASRRALPPRSEMPAILRQLFGKASRAQLTVDTGRYEIKATASGSIVRHQIAFPVSGSYPQIRKFIDSTQATMPSVALSDLSLDRKSTIDGKVEAQIRMTIYTTATGEEPARAEPQPGPDRVVTSRQAAALFAPHTWHVLEPLPLPPPPAPPPAPTAPPLPYTLVGSFSPDDKPEVFFLAHKERVIDAHVGDRLDGVYQFESVEGGQLVFVYLPLNVRQTLASGAPR
jgi:hypothetical protein